MTDRAIRSQAWAGGSDAPEKSALDIGFMALTDSASLIVAATQGFAQPYGLTLNLRRQPSWAALRDKLLSGELDAAQCLYGLVYGVQLGLGGSAASEMAVLMGLCQNGQAINLSEPLKQAGVTSAEALLRHRRQNGARLTLAQTFPTGTHALWLNYWLASIGLHPLHDVHSVVVPPAQMVGHLQAGRIDGFCAGGPWGALAVDQGQGFTIATSQAIWPDHPEKVLGTTRAFVDAYPNTARALVMAVLDASRFIEQNAENRLGTAQLISGRDYVDAPLGAIQPRFFGRYQDGLGNAWQDPHPLRFYADGEVNRPWLSDGMVHDPIPPLGPAARRPGLPGHRPQGPADRAVPRCRDGPWPAPGRRRHAPLDADRRRTWDGSDPAGYARSFPIHALAETGQGIDL